MRSEDSSARLLASRAWRAVLFCVDDDEDMDMLVAFGGKGWRRARLGFDVFVLKEKILF